MKYIKSKIIFESNSPDKLYRYLLDDDSKLTSKIIDIKISKIDSEWMDKNFNNKWNIISQSIRGEIIGLLSVYIKVEGNYEKSYNKRNKVEREVKVYNLGDDYYFIWSISHLYISDTFEGVKQYLMDICLGSSKKFESLSSPLYYQIDSSNYRGDPVPFTKLEIFSISNLFKNKKIEYRALSGDKYLELSSNPDTVRVYTGYYTNMVITKVEDDYFIIDDIDSDGIKRYRCDTFNGVVEFVGNK